MLATGSQPLLASSLVWVCHAFLGFAVVLIVALATALSLLFRQRARTGAATARGDALEREILETRRAEAQSRQSEERLGLALDGAELGVWDRNVVTGELALNRRWVEMLGYGDEEFRDPGRQWRDLVHPDDLQRVLRTRQDHLDGKTPSFQSEYRMRAESGEWKWILSKGKVSQRDKDGKAMRITGTHLDVTDRRRSEENKRRLEAHIEQAQKLESLGVLAGGIAHDFNNLLMGVLGNAELARDYMPADSPARDNLQDICKNARRGADLCRQLLVYAGRGSYSAEGVDLNKMVREISQLAAVAVPEHAALTCEFGDDLPAIKADATQIRQLVMGLITNAAEAVDEAQGNTITVATGVRDCDEQYLADADAGRDRPPGTYVFLDVTDTGHGMDRETLRRIFDPFFTTKFAGRGLGLAAVLGIVRTHAGVIKAHSRPGEGTTFSVMFPVLQRPAGPSAEEDATAPARGETVLLIDDEETVREVGRRMLETAGYTVVTAGDSAEAQLALRRNNGQITCVLLDFTMPGTSAVETLRALRSVRPDVPVIISVGFDERDTGLKLDGEGVSGFIQKPYEMDSLREKLEQVI